jgi:hypothetical protein
LRRFPIAGLQTQPGAPDSGGIRKLTAESHRRLDEALGVLDLGERRVYAAFLSVMETGFAAAIDAALEREILFAFATGYGDQVNFGEQYAAVPVLQKPYSRDQIADHLTNFLMRSAD